MRKWLLGSVAVLVLGAAVYFRVHRRAQPIETDYAANRQVSIWSTSAPVREILATANYGDKLEVLSRSGDWAEVRAASGTTGWVSQTDLISPDSWAQAQTLLSTTQSLPPVARGQTRVLSNLHLSPSRTGARIWQLNRGIPVDLFEREAAAVSPPAAAGGATEPAPAANDDTQPAEAPAEAKKEDWWLVRAKVPNHGDVAGWILGRFVDLDVPAPLPDYADAAGMRIVAWNELNDVPDGAGGTKPQYLLLGARGPEGQPCDFTTMRAYTWSKKQEQYETAFSESGLCGKLPIRIKRDGAPGGALAFSFSDSSAGTPETRTYTMRDTMIRRVREAAKAAKAAKKLGRRR
jgi:Bacterial SH3 domain